MLPTAIVWGKNMAYNELKKAAMAFELKDGNIILINHEDIQEIAYKIIVEASLMKTCTILKESDKSIEKANLLYEILKTEKNISPETRDEYLKQISFLLTKSQKVITDINSGKEVEVIK